MVKLQVVEKDVEKAAKEPENKAAKDDDNKPKKRIPIKCKG